MASGYMATLSPSDSPSTASLLAPLPVHSAHFRYWHSGVSMSSLTRKKMMPLAILHAASLILRWPRIQAPRRAKHHDGSGDGGALKRGVQLSGAVLRRAHGKDDRRVAGQLYYNQIDG